MKSLPATVSSIAVAALNSLSQLGREGVEVKNGALPVPFPASILLPFQTLRSDRSAPEKDQCSD
jgi:hypothetical protein